MHGTGIILNKPKCQEYPLISRYLLNSKPINLTNLSKNFFRSANFFTVPTFYCHCRQNSPTHLTASQVWFSSFWLVGSLKLHSNPMWGVLTFFFLFIYYLFKELDWILLKWVVSQINPQTFMLNLKILTVNYWNTFVISCIFKIEFEVYQFWYISQMIF